MFEKLIKKNQKGEITTRYIYTKLDVKNFGECFSQILFHLYNLSGEQNYMQPDYANYFNKDYGELR
jgi:hypothetical protein